MEFVDARNAHPVVLLSRSVIGREQLEFLAQLTNGDLASQDDGPFELFPKLLRTVYIQDPRAVGSHHL